MNSYPHIYFLYLVAFHIPIFFDISNEVSIDVASGQCQLFDNFRGAGRVLLPKDL
jgi:hypothetical protein